jgi:hypothetical protein
MRFTLPPPLRRFVSDEDGNVVVWQTPNAPLFTWAVFAVVGHLIRTSHLHTVVRLIAAAALIVWALLELFRGASPFRRTLGAIVLVLTVVGLLR